MASGSFALPWPQHPVPHYYHNNWVTSIKVLPKWIASKVLPFPHTDPKMWCSITKYGPQLINISPILHPNKTYPLTVKNKINTYTSSTILFYPKGPLYTNLKGLIKFLQRSPELMFSLV